MRFILIAVGIAFTVLASIVAFQNGVTYVPVYFFLEVLNNSLFFPLAMMYFLGLAAGIFWGLAINTQGDSFEDDFDV